MVVAVFDQEVVDEGVPFPGDGELGFGFDGMVGIGDDERREVSRVRFVPEGEGEFGAQAVGGIESELATARLVVAGNDAENGETEAGVVEMLADLGTRFLGTYVTS